MKAAILKAARRFGLVDVPVPQPQHGEALVRIVACGVCGSDLHMFSEGAIGGIRIEDATAPFIPGHECMGRIDAVGPGGDERLVGRRVFLEPALNCGRCRWCLEGRPNVCPHHTFFGLPPQDGCLREYLVHPLRLCEPLPDDITDDASVLLEPLAIALHAIDRLDVRPGANVAILGAGPIGLCCLLLLSHMGLGEIVVSEPLAYRRALATELGATRVLDSAQPGLVERIVELSGGHGAEHVFECAGTEATFGQMVEIAGPAARVGVVGIPAQDRLAFKHSVARRKGLDVLMIRRANLTFHRALAMALRHRLPLRRLASHHFPLADVQAAFELAAGYRDGAVKTIVNP